MDTRFFVDLHGGLFKQASAVQMDEMFSSLSGGDRNHLVVHFHGGLLLRDNIHASMAQTLLQHYQGADTHPYFFVWNSDLASTITANLARSERRKPSSACC